MFVTRRRRIPPFDPDALAYFALGNISDLTEAYAANTLIKGFKYNNIWQTFDRVHLISPTSSVTAKICAKTLNSFTTPGMTMINFSSSGFLTDGAANYIQSDLLLNAATHLTRTDSNFNVYNNALGAITKNKTLIGVANASTSTGTISSGAGPMMGSSWNTAITISYTPAGSVMDPANNSGFWNLSRRNSSSLEFYRNGFSIGSDGTTETSSIFGARPFFLGARNNVGTADNFVAIRVAFFSIGSGLTTAQQTIFYNLVQAYQTALSRQV